MKSYEHDTGTFIGFGSNEIFYQRWTVPSPRGILVIAHGIGEHSGRYENIINKLDREKISVYALDHRGHGRSGGKRGHVGSFMELIYDLKVFMQLIQEENGSVPVILLGHSMGGVVACKYALHYPEDLSALVLSSPGLKVAMKPPAWKTGMANFLSKYMPGLTMATGLPVSGLSHDEYVVEAYENDPLVHDKISARFYTEFTNTAEECMNRSLELRMPLLVFHGKDDPIVDYRGSETVFQNASSVGKELHIFDGFYHETMNETEKERVLEVVRKFILGITKSKRAKTAKKPGRKKKAAAKGAVKKKTTKKANKTTKKAASGKKPVKKTVKKAAKKTPKKSAAKKKTTKKPVKKTPKKSVKKSSKKTTGKKTTSSKKAKAKMKTSRKKK